PEVGVSGLAIDIATGDTTPSSADGTDFGWVPKNGVATRTFTVTNTGSAALNTLNLTLPAGFSLVEGLSARIAPATSDTFTVKPNPATAGTKSGQISFFNDDSDENPYTFAITGTVVAPIDSAGVTGLAQFGPNYFLYPLPDGPRLTLAK